MPSKPKRPLIKSQKADLQDTRHTIQALICHEKIFIHKTDHLNDHKIRHLSNFFSKNKFQFNSLKSQKINI